MLAPKDSKQENGGGQETVKTTDGERGGGGFESLSAHPPLCNQSVCNCLWQLDV